MANYIKGEDEIKDILSQVIGIEIALGSNNLEEVKRRTAVLRFLVEKIISLCFSRDAN